MTRAAKKEALLQTYTSRLREGVDPDNFNQLADALEDEALSKKLARER